MSRSRRRPHRPERLAALIQEALADTFTKGLKDPRVGFVTVTGVTVSQDGTHATVRVSVLGDDATKESAMEGLASAKGFLRTHLAHTLSLRTTPELHFLLDRGLEHAARIDAILTELKREEQS
jgi:ribosome-binding factor A